MSTNDVPGYNPANADTLKALCWAEHKDGSLILVESTENGRVIFSMFDISGKDKNPPTSIIEFRDAMPEKGFKQTFSWNPGRFIFKKYNNNGINFCNPKCAERMITRL